MRAGHVLALLGVALAAAGCGAAHGVSVEVTPRVSEATRPLRLVVTGLAPRERLHVDLRVTDGRGRPFRSSASFTADGSGRLVTSGVGAALLNALRSPATKDFVFRRGGERFAVSVRAGGRTVASTTFERVIVSKRLVVRRFTVAHDGFQGGYAALRGARRQPAEAGVPTLMVGYFHAPGLPDRLVNIPLEYFRRALLWLRRQPQVDPARITVVGYSYGTEAALLLGVHYPKLVHGVAALAPSGVVTCGILGAERVGGCLGSPWTLEGKPVPYTHMFNEPAPPDAPDAVIPVERIRGPIFLTCGWVDFRWSSCPYAHGILDRLAAHRSPYPHVLHAYAQAGHSSPFGRCAVIVHCALLSDTIVQTPSALPTRAPACRPNCAARL